MEVCWALVKISLMSGWPTRLGLQEGTAQNVSAPAALLFGGY